MKKKTIKKDNNNIKNKSQKHNKIKKNQVFGSNSNFKITISTTFGPKVALTARGVEKIAYELHPGRWENYSHLCMWMTSNLLARKRTIIRCGKYSRNKSIWENQHHSLIMYTWDVLQDIAEHVNILLTTTEPRSNPEFPQEQRKKRPSSENPNVSTWSYDMEGHAKKCVERCCKLAKKTAEQVHKVSTPCICLYLARSGRPHIIWSVNKLARAVTKWTRA